MKFSVNQQDLQQALNYCQGVIEKRGTLPILSNILLNANNSKLILTATDLDIIFIHQINNVEVIEEGKTTTTSSIMYDIVRKISSGKKINLTLNLTNESSETIKNLVLRIKLEGQGLTLFDPASGVARFEHLNPREKMSPKFLLT